MVESSRIAVVRQAFVDYCHGTSLHGWQYLGPKKGLYQNLVWSIAIIVSFGVAGYVFTTSTIEYMQSNTTTTIATGTAPLSRVTFPNIVICNINQLKRSFVQSISGNTGQDLHSVERFIQYFMTGLTSSLDQEQQNQLDEMIKIVQSKYEKWNETVPLQEFTSQSCPDLIIMSKYQNQGQKLFLDTFVNRNDYGQCCLVSPYLDFVNPVQWNEKQDLGSIFNQIPEGMAKSGQSNGFSFLLDIERHEYTSEGTGAVGIKIGAIHHSSKTLLSQYGYYVQEGTETLLGLDITKTVTTSQAMNLLDSANRNCYGQSEFDLKYTPRSHGYNYTLENCQYNSFVDKIIHQCDCLPFAILSGLDKNRSDPSIAWRYQHKVSCLTLTRIIIFDCFFYSFVLDKVFIVQIQS